MAYDVNFTIKKVSEDYERMKYNTAIAQMMSLVNAFYAKGQITRGELRILCQLLNPVSPHITEEINELCNLGPELFRSHFQDYSFVLVRADQPMDYGKFRTSLREVLEILPCRKDKNGLVELMNLTRENAEAYFAENAEVQKLLGGKAVRKLIFVPGRLLNIVC